MIYHILNGDALREMFPPQIEGEQIVFRECLVDGPVLPDEGQELWQLREAFILSNYPEASQDDYKTNSYEEILKIKAIPADSRIYCWFEEDLFCQVNLWFLFNYLKTHPAEVNLVLPYPDSPYHFSVLGEKELIETYEKKAKKLSPRERAVLGDLWLHFQQKNVFEALQIAGQFTERFPFLKPAVEAWRDSMPLGDYPGKPVATLQAIRDELATSDFPTLFREFHRRVPIYGFGDLQVKRIGEEAGIF
ncbi:DUF1835 domain-containing protein [Algoriphagus sp. H41]|uniref:DUF1835 domain-containing protein n=1 Tax=Algoriphagus oliviformis TaxID=2811231 RepID=A0ABS3C5Z1_9BACT|nr:DUF1835 domain-containing protein [Algoriphagus oliviformis]MBN7812539.1 DUF1835 domain-containing protein [Algoriphagus oliviformis]